MGDTPLVMNQTRGALCGGKCGDFGRGGFDNVDGVVLVMPRSGIPCNTLCRYGMFICAYF
jgi:hypothetical protein